MIVKILKGRSFSGLLDYLFNPQEKPPPWEVEARGYPENQRVSEEPSLGSSSRETDRAGPVKDGSPDNYTDREQGEDREAAGDAGREQRGDLLITNMAGRSKEKLLEHFEALAALRPDIEVNVLHGIISMPEEDVLSRETKARIIMRFADLYGLDKTMYAAIEHDEDGHKHTEIHVASSTINLKGKLPSDSFDYDKGEAIARQLEKEFGLKPNKSSRDTMQRAPTQGEWKQHEQTGKLSRPLRLQALVNSALDREVRFTEFKERLNRRGVELRLIVNDEGKVVGSVYEFEKKYIRGRRLGRGFTWPGLQQDWPEQQERKGRINYEPARDHEAFSCARSGTVGRGRTDESGEPEQLVGTVNRDREASQTIKRPAGANRKSDHPSHTIGEESRGAVCDTRARGKGTVRGDGKREKGYGDQSQPVQCAGDGDSGSDKGGISSPAQDASKVLRWNTKYPRPERASGRGVPADGGEVSANGGDEQRGLSQGERGSTRNLGEDASSSQGRNRSASQRDRDAGSILQTDVQAAEQVGHYRNGDNSSERSRRGGNGWLNDSKIQTASREGGHGYSDPIKVVETVQERNAQLKKGDDAQSSNKSKEIRQPSAVDAVLQKMLGGSSRENSTTQSTNWRKELLASKRSPQTIDKDRDEHSLPQNTIQEKQQQVEQKEPSRSSRNNRGR